ncbi:hypothetical protein MKX03_016508 [Papaver bracteatum]|nr:hypothetical protein MKX03_016508 [Papaver bracteatum]
MMQPNYEILRKQENKRFDDAAKRKAKDDKKFWEEENKRRLVREAKERERERVMVRERPAVESSAWYGPEHCPQTKLHRGGEGQTGWLIPRSGGARLRLPKDGEASHVAKKSRVDDRVYAYGECQKNHAAATGGYALDGCGEFTHGGEQGTIEFLQCGACGCHRNLHRYL